MKKFTYFTDLLRTHYFVSRQTVEQKETESIAAKTGVDVILINKILIQAEKISNQDFLLQNELLDFNKLIEDFNQQRQ
jgi:hypothetical protein